MQDQAAPLITIITAARNAAATLPRLLQSLEEQTFRDFELVVQDGDSQDGSIGVASSFQGRLPSLYFVSEPDTGIYDAWNKALCRARGTWVLFLGADDALCAPDSLERAAFSLQTAGNEIQFMGCSTVLTTQAGSPVETWHAGTTPCESIAAGMPVPHPSLFHRRDLFLHHQFSTTLKIAGDYEFLCRTLTNKNYKNARLPVTRMAVGGVSGSLPTMLDSELETLAVSSKYFPHAFRGKLYARICRSFLFRGIKAALGERAALIWADMARKAAGKTPLWAASAPAAPALPPLPSAPLVSLCIATLNRKKELTDLFASLNKQSFQNFEVLIADQNAPGYLTDALATLAPSVPVIHVPCEAPGVSRARNALLPLASGKIIAFPDDDCRYYPETLQTVVEIFSQNPHLAGVLCSWSDTPGETGRSDSPEICVTRYNAFRNAGTLVQFYRSEAIRETFFDPDLGPGTGLPYGSGEDTDYLLQIMEKGCHISRFDTLLVQHPKPDLAKNWSIEKTRNYAMGRMQLLRKHKFPLWFKLANVLYPLFCAPLESPKTLQYRGAMFVGRLRGFFSA